ncbi:MAG TPA: MFS transporter [Sphingomonas sp.]|nr:MFS transporter [Sphingomonas sp.]
MKPAAVDVGERSPLRLVIIASTLGTVFEWYDFFVYGTLAGVIAQNFFPSGNSAVSLLIALATFGVGFGMRPVGAILFGILGDRLGRKYTFLVTVSLMGGATAAVGLLPTYASIGIAAPILLVLLRIAQGLALGGEYGGAAIYVAEHAPRKRRGLYTSFIHAGVAGGFLLSIGVVLAAYGLAAKEDMAAWGWRIPFLFSLVLLAISLWVRLMLRESPVFLAMQKEGKLASNPLKESFDTWPKCRRLMIVLFGVTAGLTVIFYTAHFQSLYFIQNAVRIDDTSARLIVGLSALLSIGWYILFGWLSDKIGRKPPIIAGYVLMLIVAFPLFHLMSNAGNPDLAAATARAPVVVRGSDCSFNPLATRGQVTACGRVLDSLSKRGITYRKVAIAQGAPMVTIGSNVLVTSDDAAIERALANAGYPVGKVTPPRKRAIKVALAIVVIAFISGMTFGPVAALLVELFPARVRYTSLSIPYHIGTGYFGGFLPFINQYIVAKTGDPFAGIWYTVGVTAIALLVVALGIPETAGRDLE